MTLHYQRSSPCIEVELSLFEEHEGNQFTHHRKLVLPSGDPADFGQWQPITANLPSSKWGTVNNETTRFIRLMAKFNPGSGLFGCDSTRGNWLAVDSFRYSPYSCSRQVSATFVGPSSKIVMNNRPSSRFLPWLSGDGISLSDTPLPERKLRGPTEYAIVDFTQRSAEPNLPMQAFFSTDYLYGSNRPVVVHFEYAVSRNAHLWIQLESIFDGRDKTIWNLKSSDGEWHFGRANFIQPNTPYRIGFYASSSLPSDSSVAISNIEMIEGLFGFSIEYDSPPESPTTTPFEPTTHETEATESSTETTGSGSSASPSASTNTSPEVTTPSVTTVKPPVVEKVHPVLIGEMETSQVLIGGEIKTWNDISQSDELKEETRKIMESQVKLVHDTAGISYSELTVTRISSSNSKSDSIKAEYKVVSTDEILSDAETVAKYQSDMNSQVKDTVSTMASKGAFDEAFGNGASVSVEISSVELQQIDKPKDDTAEIVAIVLSSIFGSIFLLLVVIFGYRSCDTSKQTDVENSQQGSHEMSDFVVKSPQTPTVYATPVFSQVGVVQNDVQPAEPSPYASVVASLVS